MNKATIGLALLVGIVVGFVAYPLVMKNKSNFKG